MRKGKPQKQIHDDSVSLNKYISDTGFCSRREADDYIAQARVTINQELAEPGNRVYEGDVVEIDGEPIKKKSKTIYIAFNKPEGVTSTTDRADKTNIVDYINHKVRIFPVGRLDKESEGLIFLTNDGNIVNKILRAGNNHEKEYLVTVDKPITTDFIRTMSQGVRILGQKTKPCKVVQEGKYMFRIILTQGINRQIRRMCSVLEYKVVRLVRIRIMNVSLGKLPVGHWRYLTPEEIDIISKMVSESSKTEEASFKGRRVESGERKGESGGGKGEPKKAEGRRQKAEVPKTSKKAAVAGEKVADSPKKSRGFKEYRKSGKK
jgi:23S rRNA pseudouridine2604 synthase